MQEDKEQVFDAADNLMLALALGIGCALPLYLFIRSRRIV